VAEGKRQFYIEPLNRFVPTAPGDYYVVYAGDDVIPGEGTCGAGHDAAHAIEHLQSTHEAKAGDDCRKLEIATESDWEFYDDDFTFSDIVGNLNMVESVYMNYYNMKFIVVYQHQWTTSSDPYTTDESGCGGTGTLQQFAAYWFNNFSNIRRDINVYYSQKDFSGSTIGCAMTGQFGNGNNNSGYFANLSGGVQQIRGAYNVNEWNYNGFLSTDAGRRTLVAHEMGHNFGAAHDDSNCGIFSSGNIMCSSINTSTTFLNTAQTQMITDMDWASVELNDGRSALRIREIPANSNSTTVTMFGAGTVSGNQLDLSAAFLYNTFLFPFSGTRTFQATEKVRMLPGFKIAAVGSNKVVVKTGACDINSSLNATIQNDSNFGDEDFSTVDQGIAIVYPNPSVDVVSLDMTAMNGATLRIGVYDSYGRSLLAFEKQADGQAIKQIDLSTFANGMYLIKITDQNNQMKQTLKVQKIN